MKLWIIGASSGLGAELAKLYNQPNHSIAISARRKQALQQIVDQHSQANYLSCPMDIRKISDVQTTTEYLINTWGRIDKIIITAGCYYPKQLIDLDLDELHEQIATNFFGSCYVVKSVLPYCQEKKIGQLVFVSSASAHMGLPNGQPYGASKAALTNFVESLKIELGKTVDIRLVSPGFFESDLTKKNNFYMPRLISTKSAAQLLVKGIESKRFDIHFPKSFTLILRLLSILPRFIVRRFISK